MIRAGSGGDEALDAEILREAEALVDLDGPRIEAWVSGLFELWDGDEQAARSLLERCRSQRGPTAALLACTVAHLATGALRDTARAVADELGADAPAVVGEIGRNWAVHQALRVDAPFGTSIVLEFAGPAGEHHSLLVELERSGSLGDIQLTGTVADLAEEQGPAAQLHVEALEVADAVAMVVGGWKAVSPEAVLGPGVAANEHFARRRIELLTGVDLPPLRRTAPVRVLDDGIDADERAEANRAALSTLRAAVGDIGDVDTASARDAHRGWLEVVTAQVGGLNARQLAALRWLEWADWLGAGLGIWRAGPDTAVDGQLMVDFVNRCPEVSSSIERRDREYAAWAFGVALEHLTDCGAVLDGQLTEDGHRALLPALAEAWAPAPR